MSLDGLAVHRSTERTPGDRGLALGRAQRDPIANTVAVYERLFSEDVGLDRDEVLRRGAQVGARIGAVRADLVEEIAGIAAGSGHPPELLLAVNARTELLAGGALATGGGECSVAGTIAGGCVLAQNWDFHPDLAPSRLLWTVEDRFTIFTEAGIVAKTGINADGLALTLNFLASDGDGAGDDMPLHVLLRMLLDGCADHDDARRLLQDTSVSASACITVASAAPASLISYELSPRGVRAIEADGHGHIAHTNHFLADVPVRDIGVGPNSVSRLEQVRAGLETIDGDEPGALYALLSTQVEPDPVFRHADPNDPWVLRCATLATVVYDVAARRMWIRVAADPSAPLVEVAL